MPDSDTKTFHAGWLIDGSGRPPERDVLIAVAGGRIERLGRMEAPQADRQRAEDFAACTILPGLIDAHVHLFMSGTCDLDIREKQLDAGFESVCGDIERRLQQCLAHGIIAVRDGGDRHGHALAYKQKTLDPRVTPVTLFTAGRAWRRAERYGRLIGRPPARGGSLAASLAQSRETVDQVKIVNSGLNSLVRYGLETPPQFSLDEMTAAVTAARRLGLKTMVHANGRVPVAFAVKAGCDSIEHGFFMGRDNLARMADRQTVWVPTAGTMRAYVDFMARRENGCRGGNRRPATSAGLLSPVEGARRNLDHQMEQISAAAALGVPIAAGTDAGSPGVDHGKYLPVEMDILMAAGLSVQAAVASATSINARLLGLPQGGLVVKGAPATFVVVPGTPAEMPRSLGAITALFIDGKKWCAE